MNRFDRVTLNPAVASGQSCVRGMRLTVKRVLEADQCCAFAMKV